MQETKIGFIGAGNMAASIIGGLISQGQPPANVFASDLDAAKLAALATSTGLQAASNTEIAQQADVIVLAVKPWGTPPAAHLNRSGNKSLGAHGLVWQRRQPSALHAQYSSPSRQRRKWAVR